MEQIINMTPHPVNIVDADGNNVFTFPKGENTIRLSVSVKKTGVLGQDIPVSETIFGEPVGLPEYKLGTFYIVSQLVKSALVDRHDLLVPAEVVRDSNGNILGCQSLGI